MLKFHAEINQEELKPTFIVSDFETSLKKALEKNFPEAKQLG